MDELSEFEVGRTVEVHDGKIGIVQSIGYTDFAAGNWIRVVLDTATGKNDGSVKGQRYFTCEPGHGMYVRHSAAATTMQQQCHRKAKLYSKDALQDTMNLVFAFREINWGSNKRSGLTLIFSCPVVDADSCILR